MRQLINVIRIRIEQRKDKRVRRLYTALIRDKHISLIEAYNTAHNRVYHHLA